MTTEYKRLAAEFGWQAKGPRYRHPRTGTLSYHPHRPRFLNAGNPAGFQVAEHIADYQAWLMRIRDERTYDEIARALGWSHRSSAYRAVWRFNRRRLDDDRRQSATRAGRAARRHHDVLLDRCFWEDNGLDRPPSYAALAAKHGYASSSGAWKACQFALEACIETIHRNSPTLDTVSNTSTNDAGRFGAFTGLSATERIDQAGQAAATIALILEAINAGDLDGTAERRAYLRGTLDALTAIAADR